MCHAALEPGRVFVGRPRWVCVKSVLFVQRPFTNGMVSSCSTEAETRSLNPQGSTVERKLSL